MALEGIDAAVLDRAASLFAAFAPFDFVFEGVGRFAATTGLAPDRARPLSR